LPWDLGKFFHAGEKRLLINSGLSRSRAHRERSFALGGHKCGPRDILYIVRATTMQGGAQEKERDRSESDLAGTGSWSGGVQPTPEVKEE